VTSLEPTTPTGKRLVYGVPPVVWDAREIIDVELEAKSMRDEEIKDTLRRYYNDHYLAYEEYQAVSGLMKALAEETE